jgi:hypothetical protein
MHALKLTLYKPSSKQCLPYPDWRIGEHAEDLMMSQLEELTPDERRIAKEFRLTQYFNRNKKYAKYIASSFLPEDFYVFVIMVLSVKQTDSAD